MQVTLKLRDQVSAESAKALADVRKGVHSAGAAVADTGKAALVAGRATQQAARQSAQAMEQQAASTQRAAKATRDVGQAAADAKAGAAKLVAELDKLGIQERKVLGLVGRLRQVDQVARQAERGLSSAASAAGRLTQGIAQGGAALAAGGYVAGRALAPAVSFEKRLGLMANTAFSDRGASGRIAGKKELRAAIENATDIGGGSREEAAEGLNTMLAAGMDAKKAMTLLPHLQKAATGSGADVNDLAKLVTKGLAQGFFTEAQVSEALDKAVAAGQAGQFELNDMAKWLPQLLAEAKGMKGMAGYETILSSLQGVAVTTGSNEKAGNALSNLFGQITHQSTQQDFAKLGIDLSGSLARAAAQGQNPLDAFVRLVEKEVVGKDAKFQAIKAQIASASGDEKKALLGQAAELLQGSAVGKVIQDKEAGLALTALLTQKDTIADARAKVASSTGAVDTSFETMRHGTDHAQQRAKNAVENARSRMLDDVKPALDTALNGFAAIGKAFPSLATVVVEASTAIGTVATIGMALGGLRMLTGGGAKAASDAAAGAGASSPGFFGRLRAGWASSAGRWAGRAGGLFSVLGAGMDVATTEYDDSLTRAQKNAAHTGTAGGVAGGWGGAVLGGKAGAAVGTAFMPGVGTVVGGVAGGSLGWALGYFGGKSVGKMAGDVVFSENSAQQVRVTGVLKGDGRDLYAIIDSRSRVEAQRH